MKKLLLLGVFALFAVGATQAQNQFRIGANFGVPLADADDFAIFAIAVDLGYLFELNDNFRVGPTTGVKHFFGDTFANAFGADFDYDDATFIPIAGTARFSAFENFWFGADLGYAFGLNGDDDVLVDDDFEIVYYRGPDGGLWFRPHASYDFGPVAVTAGFTGIAADGGVLGSFNVGAEIGID